MAFLQRATLRSSPKHVFRLRGKAWKPLLGIVLAVAAGYIPARLAIAQWQAPKPQAILTLGGRPAREAFTADFARLHPELKIWVSSGLRPNDAHALFRKQNIPDDRVNLDYRALDTVTNFTTLVSDLEQQDIHHIYLITSDYHMARSKAIATIVLGSHGITFTAIGVPSAKPPEDSVHIARDVTRSLIWLVSGYTGAELRGD
jgi:uncharacterized SAM-binding protein YcdF (DUF218 family)